ncbi:glycosyltransferase [Glycomyces sp. NPDC047369]
MTHTPSERPDRAIVRRNGYEAVRPAGDLRPTRTVSVVVPAYLDQAKLDLTLAALAAQTYPGELMDVVVADDGSEPPLRLPELRPQRTRIVRTPEGSWGIAAAVDAAIRASEGEVVLRLDSDVVPVRGHVEAHMRWHHAGEEFVVLGKLVFVDTDAEDLRPEKVRDAVAAGGTRALFEGLEYDEDWQIGLVRESGGRIDDEVRAFITANGATVSFTRELHDACGGLDRSMPLGSDTEFGYRLAQQGAVFVPEAKAGAWHLGMSQMKSARKKAGTRFRHQYMAGRVPSLRYLRNRPGLQWRVPYVEVVVEIGEARLEHVRTTLTSVFGGSLQDASAVLIGPWGELGAERVAPLDDPLLELRLIREAFGGDPRVSFSEAPDRTAAPTPFRLVLPAGAALEFDGLQSLVAHADGRRLGLVELEDPEEGRVAVLERTAAVNRALRLGLGADAAAIERVWGAAVEPADRWLRAAKGAEGALARRRRMARLELELKRLRADERYAAFEANRLGRFAVRVRRGLGRRARRVLGR